MGCDKAFLPFGASSLLDYQISRFRPYFENIYLSVPARANRPVNYQEQFGCPAIEDAIPNLGPLGGLFSCMKEIPEEILFFTSVDAPFTDPALAAALCDCLSSAASADVRACAIRSFSGQLQPLFAAYQKNMLPDISRQISRKNYRLRALFHENNTIIYEGTFPAEQFFNMNDPASYYHALQKLAQIQPNAFPPEFSAKTEHKKIPVFSFIARSGTGKTTYLEKLLPLLERQRLRIAVVKHDAHGFEIDKPGKDSYRLTRAGAKHMILSSADQTAAIITHPGLNPGLDLLLKHIENADCILTEGYKMEHQKKICLLRRGYSETPVGDPRQIIAYVTDFPFQADVPVFDLNRPEELIPFLLNCIRKDSSAF